MSIVDRRAYAEMYGPTTGDRVRLADTELWIRIEDDYTTYGEEVKFGGGKVIRDGMGQSQRLRADVMDTVITNAVIVDWWGIVKADIGLFDGRIAAIGKAGNPDIQPGVTIRHRRVDRGHRRRRHDPHRRRHRQPHPLHLPAADRRGAVVRRDDDARRRHRPGDRHQRDHLHARRVEHAPYARGGRRVPDEPRLPRQGQCFPARPAVEEQIEAGAMGLKLHEDWGTTPAAIDNCLAVADLHDVQVAIHTDTLNEAGFVETTVAAFAGRTIHTYHTEGAGGGHAPDILKVCGVPHVLPSSTNPTGPTRSTPWTNTWTC